MLRALHLGVYGALAALAIAIVIRPAALWVRSLGLFGPALRCQVPLGPAFAAIAFAVVACTVTLAHRLSIRRKPGLLAHTALLVLVAAAITIRGGASQPRWSPAHPPLQMPPPATSTSGFPAYPDASVLNAR